MKKVLWLLCLLPIFMGKVYASDIYYSDYSTFSNWSENKVDASDIKNVETEKRYLWYQMERTLGDYKLYEKEGNFSDDCYVTDKSNWSTIKPAQTDSRTIYTRNQYTYELVKGARYIHFTDIKGSYGALRFTELRVIVDGKDLAYQVECKDCREGFENYIHNGIIAENKSYIHNGGSLIIDLGKIYPIHKIEIQFYLFDMGTDTKTYKIGFSEDKTDIYASKNYSLNFTHATYDETKYITHTISNMDIPQTNWVSVITTTTPDTSEFQLSSSVKTEYAYDEKWCKVYIEEKKYNTVYTKNAIGSYTFCDENHAKIFYRYQTRDKLELSDNSIITQRNFDMNNLVVNSTKPYTIEQNIDLTKNGIYPVTFKSGAITATKEVTVRILENEMDGYEEEISVLKEQIKGYQNEIINLQEQLKQLQDSWQNEKTNYDNRILNLDEQIKNLQNELGSCQANCQRDQECLQALIEEKDNLLKEYEDRLLTLSNQINEYQLQIQNQKEELAHLTNENEEYQDTIASLKQQIEDLTRTSKELNETVIKDYQEQLKEKEALLEEYTVQIEQLNEQLKYLQENIEKIKQDKNQSDQNNQELQSMLKDYQKQLKEKEKLLNEYAKTIEKLTKQLDKFQRNLEKMTERNSQFQQENKELQKLLKEYQKQLKEKEKLLKIDAETIEKLRKELDELVMNMGQAIEANDQSLKENNQLQISIKEYQEKLEGKEKLIKAYVNKIEELTRQLNRIQGNIGQVIEERNQFQQQGNELQRLVKELTQQKDDLQQEFDKQKEKSCTDLSQELEISNQEKDELNQKLNNYMLKIQKHSAGNWLWFCILILICSFGLVFYSWKKKSNIK